AGAERELGPAAAGAGRAGGTRGSGGEEAGLQHRAVRIVKYHMVTYYNGVLRDETEVDDQFVKNYTSKETLEFFRRLGGTELIQRRPGGRLFVQSVSPDEATKKVVIFTPLPEATRG